MGFKMRRTKQSTILNKQIQPSWLPYTFEAGDKATSRIGLVIVLTTWLT